LTVSEEASAGMSALDRDIAINGDAGQAESLQQAKKKELTGKK